MISVEKSDEILDKKKKDKFIDMQYAWTEPLQHESEEQKKNLP